MSHPIVKDNLFVVLNSANGWTSSGNLNAPIINAERCRVLANNNALIKTNFLQDTYILDSTQASAYKTQGLVPTGDEKTWFVVKDKNIKNPQVTLESNITFDSLAINFQFI